MTTPLEQWQAQWRAYALSLPDAAPGTPRCVCGYEQALHALGTQLCPDPPSGSKPKFRPAPAAAEPLSWREVMRRDVLARRAADEAARAAYVPDDVRPPQVPARHPQNQAEVASYRRRQAAGLGRAALAAGWSARILYWRDADGVEGSGVWIAGPAGERALATWKRSGKIGQLSGWKGDVAFAWREGELPRKVGHTDLEKIFTT
jgi:hypothetical protein